MGFQISPIQPECINYLIHASTYLRFVFDRLPLSVAMFFAARGAANLWLSPHKCRAAGQLIAASIGILPPPHIGSQTTSPVSILHNLCTQERTGN